MGTLRNDRTVLASEPSPRANVSDHEWSNSYVGVRGRLPLGTATVGYDLQGLVDLQGTVADNFRVRDGYLFVEHPLLGRLQAGQMDSMYKLFGDRVRMFGVTSGNFFGVSRMLSNVGWRGQGVTTFHNRVGHTLNWFSPAWNGLDVGVTHSFAAVDGSPVRDATLSAAGVRWRQGPWHVALATEVHRDWLPLSAGSAGTVPAATSILNSPSTARSRDQAWRLSFAWTPKNWRFATDVARLRYTETDPADLPGKFRGYATTTWSVAAEHQLTEKWRLGFNHARGSAGNCALSGGVACSTAGFGAFMTSVGVLYSLNREASVFLVANHLHNGPGTRYASAPTGASFDGFALGVKYQFR